MGMAGDPCSCSTHLNHSSLRAQTAKLLLPQTRRASTALPGPDHARW